MEKCVHIANESAMIVMNRYEQSPQNQSSYQSEQTLEESFIAKHVNQGFERLHINSESDMLKNLHQQLEFFDGNQKSSKNRRG